MSQKFLWSFYWDCGRSGSLEGLFVATKEEIEEVTGEEAYFGEVLGKHSEVYGTLDEEDITQIDISPEAVEEVSKHLGDTWSGWNPLEYVRLYCDRCGDRMGYDEVFYYDIHDPILDEKYKRICSPCMESVQGGDE